MTMRVLIADDERVAIERLELGLSCVPEADLVGVAHSGTEAVALIRERQPDVVLLDIQMPGHNGFGVLSSLRASDKIPEVIFVSAFDNHAIKAFEIHAVDYLLKPVPFERLRDALRRARARLEARNADARFEELQQVLSDLAQGSANATKPRFEKAIWIKQRDGLSRVPVHEIDLFEAAGDYVIAHVGDQTHFLSDSISGLQCRLDPNSMLRVHRSTIINLERVRNLRRRGPRAMALIMHSGRQVAIGPSYLESVLTAVNARRWKG